MEESTKICWKRFVIAFNSHHELAKLWFLYSCIQTTKLKLTVYHALNSHQNGSSINKFSIAMHPLASPLPVPATLFFLKVGRQFQSSWWMLARRVVSTIKSQMANNNILYTHPFVSYLEGILLIKNFIKILNFKHAKATGCS